MLYWECKRRLETLLRFRSIGADYFTNIRLIGFGEAPLEDDAARQARRTMNSMLGEVTESFELIGLSSSVYYSPPPRLGGPAGRMDLIANIFELWRFQLDPRQAQDLMERAIGEYQRLTRRLLLQSFNPFFWLKYGLGKLLSIPFAILAVAGFDARKIERSLFGKLFKAIAGFVTFLAALIGILAALDLLEPLKRFLHRF